ncbi:MAG: hypothetical protein ACSHXK_09660 [Oceanococcus sp.]
MNNSNHSLPSPAAVQNSISGLGLVFLLGFMLLCSLGVMRGWNAQSGAELFGYNYIISSEQVPLKVS